MVTPRASESCGTWVEESAWLAGQDTSILWELALSLSWESFLIGQLPASSPVSQAMAEWSSNRGDSMACKAPGGALQNVALCRISLLTLGRDSAEAALGTNPYMNVYGCGGYNFIYRNRWQLGSVCGLWLADPDLGHKLHLTEAHRDFQLSRARCCSPPTRSHIHSQCSITAWQADTGWLSRVSSFQVEPTTTFQSEREAVEHGRPL